MKNILITGGSGFIGSHTCLYLVQNGYKVVILDNLTNSSYKSINRIKKILSNLNIDSNNKIDFIKGDIRDEKLLDKIFKKYNLNNESIASVIHFAGLKSISESILSPLDYWDQNIGGTLSLVKSMAKNNCKKLVFSSSATVYGSKYKTSLKENFHKFPINPYGETKNTIEKMLHNVQYADEQWNIINLRYFNPIGAHSSGLLGELSISKTDNLFPSLCRAASGELKELKIYGNDWPTRDGTPIRDYIHIMDVAEGHLRAIDFLFSREKGITSINLGTGKNSTVLELIKVFEKVNKVNINYVFSDKRIGDPPKLIANVLLAKKLLKWKAKRNLEEMCKDGWKWYLSNLFSKK